MEVRKGYKQTEVGVIPEDWNAYCLQNVISRSQLGGNYPNSINETDAPLIKMGNIGRGTIQLDRLEYVSKSSKPSEMDRIHSGDILFNTRNTLDLVGKVAVWRDELPIAFFNSNILRLEFKSSKVSSNAYVNYQFNTSQSLRQLKEIATGTTSVAAIYGRDLSKYLMILPPLPEQRAIAEALSDVDALIAKLDALIAKKRAIKQGAMQQLLTGKTRLPGFEKKTGYKQTDIGLIPEDWKVRRQHEVVNYINGRAFKLSEWERDGTPVIRLQNLTGTGDEFYYSTLNLPDRQYVESGDLIFMWSASFGPYIWNGPKAIFHYHIWKIDCDKARIDKAFYYYKLLELTETVRNETNGSTMLHITKGSMEEYELAIPPNISEQSAIASVLSDIDAEINTLEEKRSKTKALKQGMMQELLTGRIRLI